MTTVVLILHILACVGLILVILLQAGKGANMGAAFGGASQTVFGSSGAATFLTKATTGVAVLFMVTSLGLAIFAHSGGSADSVMKQAAQPVQTQQAPAKPAPAPEKQKAVPAPPAPSAPGAKTN